MLHESWYPSAPLGGERRHRDSWGARCKNAFNIPAYLQRLTEVIGYQGRHGALHVLYNNAGIGGDGIDTDVTQLSVETWECILNINLRGIFLCSKSGGPLMLGSSTASLACPTYTASWAIRRPARPGRALLWSRFYEPSDRLQRFSRAFFNCMYGHTLLECASHAGALAARSHAVGDKQA